MIQFEHTEVSNFEGALRGMRNSWESWDKSDSYWGPVFYNPETGRYSEKYIIGPEDMKLAMKLSKAGSDHAKFLRQIFVSVDITAPEYWWKEMDTYKVGTVANSTSMMHKAGSRAFGASDFSFDTVSATERAMIDELNRLRSTWLNQGGKKPSPEWRRMIQAVPQSFLYRRTWTANYQVLKNIYFARKSHRLEEWHEMAHWIESLPYSQLITLKEVEK